MRLVSTLDDQHKAYALSTFLTHHGIENQLELITNSDWGSQNYGTVTSRIWVVDEEQFENALKWVNDFLQHSDDPKFYEFVNDSSSVFSKNTEIDAEGIPAPKNPSEKEGFGLITSYLLFLCIFLFIASSISAPIVKKIPPGIPYAPVLTPPINKPLMYDYLKAYEIIDQLVSTYGLESLEKPENLPNAGQELLKQYQNTPVWNGFYPLIIAKLKTAKETLEINAPLFEKIREGEVWRLFTPVLLHHDLFHLFFNMIWLIVLGKQLESRLKTFRYILFILLTGIFSNTAQYFMSGANFIGFSGILCAMLAFIWVRLRNTPWEGYRLERSTISFIAFFVLFMFSLQLISFFIESFTQNAFSIGIANTAHLAGALIGFILGHLNTFSWQEK